MHHGANDRIIMKCLTSDVLESKGRCQQNDTSLRGEHRTAHARGTIKSRNIIEFPLFFFFSLSFSTREKLPAKGAVTDGRHRAACSEGRLPAVLACGCLAPARALCWDAARQSEQQMLPLGMEEGEGPAGPTRPFGPARTGSWGKTPKSAQNLSCCYTGM